MRRMPTLEEVLAAFRGASELTLTSGGITLKFLVREARRRTSPLGTITSVQLDLDSTGAPAFTGTDWEVDSFRWRGRVLNGEYAHWCTEWDDLPVDETCEEWPCDCNIGLAAQRKDARVQALKRRQQRRRVGAKDLDIIFDGPGWRGRIAGAIDLPGGDKLVVVAPAGRGPRDAQQSNGRRRPHHADPRPDDGTRQAGVHAKDSRADVSVVSARVDGTRRRPVSKVPKRYRSSKR